MVRRSDLIAVAEKGAWSAPLETVWVETYCNDEDARRWVDIFRRRRFANHFAFVIMIHDEPMKGKWWRQWIVSAVKITAITSAIENGSWDEPFTADWVGDWCTRRDSSISSVPIHPVDSRQTEDRVAFLILDDACFKRGRQLLDGECEDGETASGRRSRSPLRHCRRMQDWPQRFPFCRAVGN